MNGEAARGTDATDVRVLLVTAPEEAAEELVRALVEEHLVACGNVVPGLVSIFRWEGGVERSTEVLLMLKTRRDRVEELTERIAELHPYDVPEVLALPVSEGSAPYLEWVLRETVAPDGEPG